MYGTGGRIGLAILHSDFTIEGDLRRLLNDEVEVHVARVRYPAQVSADNLAIAETGLEAAFASLLAVRPSVLAWACTSGSFYNGVPGHRALLRRMREFSGQVPVTTATESLIEALRALGVARPSVGTPYSRDINNRLGRFLDQSGVSPVAVTQLYGDEIDDYALQDIEDDQVGAFIERLDRPDCDGVVVSCTGLPSARAAAAAEARIDKPVITSNLALLWQCWRLGRLSGRPLASCRLFSLI